MKDDPSEILEPPKTDLLFGKIISPDVADFHQNWNKSARPTRLAPRLSRKDALPFTTGF